jgi:hypothetical protein
MIYIAPTMTLQLIQVLLPDIQMLKSDVKEYNSQKTLNLCNGIADQGIDFE